MRTFSIKRGSAVLPACMLALLLCGCSQTEESLSRKHMDRGMACLKKNQLRMAILEFKVASQNTPKKTEPLYQLGLACLAFRDGQCAMEAFDKVLRLDRNHEGALAQLGRLQAAASQPVILRSAEELLGRLLQQHPANKSVRYLLAAVQIKLDKKELALAGYDAALALS